MGELTHKATRAAFGKAIELTLKHVEKDREKGLLQLVDLTEKFIRNHCRCYLIMLTMESTGKTSPSIEKAEQALLQMEEIIRKSIRKIDIVTVPCNT